ncbi:MAG: mechanosensitive ion channel family protein, partial [Treponema sp.]|nr:mechanosensitive ion channel family protein [Treponema sp.]
MGIKKQWAAFIITACLIVLPFGIEAQDTAEVETEAPALLADESMPKEIAELGETVENLSNNLSDNIEETVTNDTKDMNVFIRFGIAAAIIIGQILLIKLVWFLFKILNVKITIYGEKNFKPLKFKRYRIMETKQILNLIYFLLKICKYVFTVFQLFITIPIVFSLFPLTKNLASTLFGYILTPLKTISLGIIRYIPNLFTIIIIIFIVRYVLRSLRFLSTQIAKEKLVIPGFYADWAQPTFNILRVLLYAFTVAIIYPYLPGSDSAIFQGVSVFVGIIFSLGSSSAIGNLVAGVVITYMRPFKIGDRIKLNDVTGFVVEKSPIVTRVRTHKNEYVTFPNVTVLTSSIINYHTSSEEKEEGLILHADVTMGYAVPWPQVHDILITAALKTSRTEKKPKPFVLQTTLDDFYANYQINVYTKEVDRVPSIYSELYQNLQDGF